MTSYLLTMWRIAVAMLLLVAALTPAVWAGDRSSTLDPAEQQRLRDVEFTAYPNSPAKGTLRGTSVSIAYADYSPTKRMLVLHEEVGRDSRPCAMIQFTPETKIDLVNGTTLSAAAVDNDLVSRMPSLGVRQISFIYYKERDSTPRNVLPNNGAFRLSFMPGSKKNTKGQLPLFIILRFAPADGEISGLCWLDVVK